MLGLRHDLDSHQDGRKSTCESKGSPVPAVDSHKLDEHVSPSLVGKLGDKGVLAVAAAHVGLSGEPDAKIWNYAFEMTLS